MANIVPTSRSEERNGNLSRKSLPNKLQMLGGALKYFNRPLEREVWSACYLWIDNLALNGELNLLSYEQATAYSEDVSVLWQALCNPEYLWLNRHKFPSMDEVLKYALLLNFNIDLCGRVGELLHHHHDSANKDENSMPLASWKDEILIWKRVTFKVFVTNEGTKSLLTLIRITGMKGQKDRPDLSWEIPLVLLAP